MSHSASEPHLCKPTKTQLPNGDLKLTSHFCSCQDDFCKCCVDFDEPHLGLNNDTLCVDIGYVKQNIGIKAEVTWNGKSVISEEISAKNPPPICAEVPIPKLEVSRRNRF